MIRRRKDSGAGLRDDGSVLVSLGTYIGGMMRGEGIYRYGF